MDEIFEEIQQDLREEKLKTLWNKYKKTLFISLSVVFSILLTFLMIFHLKEEKKIEAAQAFLAAEKKIDQGDLKGGVEGLETLIKTTSHETYKTMARLRLSALPSVSDKERVKIYEEILQDRDTPSSLKENILLMKALILIDTIEETHIPELIQSLEDLKKGKNPLGPLAHELTALLYYRLHRYTEAAQQASQVIAHPHTSEEGRVRAKAILHQSDLKLGEEKGSSSQPLPEKAKS